MRKATLDEVIRGELVDLLMDYEKCHLIYAWDLADTITDEIMANKPWWWIINMVYSYSKDLKKIIDKYHIPMHGDSTDMAKHAIKMRVAEMLVSCDTVIDTWKEYKNCDFPAMLDHEVARHIGFDLLFED